jgi:hypothetical protein
MPKVQQMAVEFGQAQQAKAAAAAAVQSTPPATGAQSATPTTAPVAK